MRPIAIVLVLLLAVADAAAQGAPTAEQKRAAKTHFQQGRAFYEAGAYADAVSAYQRAFALVPLPDLLFNIAQAYRMQGELEKAYAAAKEHLFAWPELNEAVINLDDPFGRKLMADTTATLRIGYTLDNNSVQVVG